MSKVVETEALIDAIYDAALEPARWAALLEDIRGHTHVATAQLTLMDANLGAETIASSGASPTFARAYEDQFLSSSTVWCNQMAASRPLGTVLTNNTGFRTAFERSDFYQYWARPLGLNAVAVAKVFHESASLGFLCCATERLINRKSGDQAEELLGRLAIHFQRALRVALRISSLSQERDDAGSALDLLKPAIFVVSRSACVTYANRAAQALLSQPDGLGSDHAGLQASTPALTRRLHELVGRAASTNPGEAVGGAMSVDRPSRKRAWQVLVTPAHRGTSWATLTGHREAAVVLVIDPEAEEGSVSEVLQALYGLTPAETRVAAAVGRGQGVIATADELGVCQSTARTHLRQVFVKTDTRRQAELVRLVDRITLLRHQQNASTMERISHDTWGGHLPKTRAWEDRNDGA